MSGQYWCGEGDEADELMEAAADPRMRTAPEDEEMGGQAAALRAGADQD